MMSGTSAIAKPMMNTSVNLFHVKNDVESVELVLAGTGRGPGPV